MIFIFIISISKGIGQLPRVSGKDPERKEWTSVFETLVLCSVFFVSKFSNFYTVQYGRVQYSTGIYLVPRYGPTQYITIQYNTLQYNTLQYKILNLFAKILNLLHG